MKRLLAFSALAIAAAQPADAVTLTIYNQNFAVIRDTVPLDLKPGINQVKFAEATMHLEPDSVVLRDPTGKQKLSILEQGFRADPISQELLLSLFEGKEIDFLTREDNKSVYRRGKIIRSGYVPHYSGMRRYGQEYMQTQMALSHGVGGITPIIEMNGTLRFGLPGQPLFPTLGDDTILKPTLSWTISTDQAGKLDAELGYITGGMSWEADYNVVAPEKENVLEITGWVTMDNQTGKSFDKAKIKLMAGDVNKLTPPEMESRGGMKRATLAAFDAQEANVTEKSFDEYHLYSLQRETTLRDRETKQVEFVRASGVRATPIYVYDGVKLPSHYGGWNYENIRQDREYGTQSNPKVAVMREFSNSTTNQLGMPLPRGRLRFYRRDSDGQLEFTGENIIDHTPRNEWIKVRTGDAFDLVGERIRKDHRQDDSRKSMEETFEIKLRNRKKEAVEIRVVEHLYRWTNWQIRQNSAPFTKKDAQTIEFNVRVEPDSETKISYTASYSW